MELTLQKKEFDYSKQVADEGTVPAHQACLMDVFRKELPQLKYIIAGMGFCRADAEDIIQDVSLEVLKRRAANNPVDLPAAWLKRITVNKCISEYRRRKRFQQKTKAILQHQLEVTKSTAQPDEAIIHEEKREMIRQALKNLDDTLLAPLVLRYYCGHTSDRIADILNLKPSSVRTRLCKARMLLADILTRSTDKNGKR